jgi:predicted component of type VI protein secretion system
MRIETPLAIPAVVAPQFDDGAATRGTRPNLLQAPVMVLAPWGAVELELGSLLIGRLPECDICLNDNLVSRMHARISIEEDSVLIEDLHSTNGIYVNRGRVQQQVRACEGDRLLIGSTELSIFQGQREPRGVRSAPRPPSGASLLSARTQSPVHDSAPSRRTAPLPATPTTTRSNALQLIGGLADRLAAEGSLQEAAEVLSEHLKGIQRGAIAGLAVTDAQVACASEYALRLARWTSRVGWVEYVVELHLAASVLMTESVLSELELALERFPSFDRGLLRYYLEQQQRQCRHATESERARLSQMVQLAKR